MSWTQLTFLILSTSVSNQFTETTAHTSTPLPPSQQLNRTAWQTGAEVKTPKQAKIKSHFTLILGDEKFT